jgi:hypothetical protein
MIFAAAIILSVACNDNPVSGNSDNQPGQMSAIVNGVSWKSSSAMALIAEKAPKPFISFQGTLEEKGRPVSQIIFMTDNRTFTTPQTIVYPYLVLDSVEYSMTYHLIAKADSGLYMCVNGEAIISSFGGIGGRTNGTFWFSGVNIYGDTVKVWQGKFDLPVRKSTTQ